MANTVSMVAGSYMNSVGMSVLSGGMTDVNIGFGAGSYNITQNEWSGIWTWGDNTFIENVGYVVGKISNINDFSNSYKQLFGNSDDYGNALLRTQKDFKSHSQLEWEYNGEKYNISVGNGQFKTRFF